MAGFPRGVVAGEGDPLPATAGRSLPRCGCRRLSLEVGSPGGAGGDPGRPRGEGRGGDTSFSRSPEWEERSAKALGSAGSVPEEEARGISERHPCAPPLLFFIQGRRECCRHLWRSPEEGHQTKT